MGAVPPLPQYAFMALCSVRGSTGSSFRPIQTFRNILDTLMSGVVSPHPDAKLEGHHFSAVRECFFTIFNLPNTTEARLFRKLRAHHAVVTRNSPNVDH
jgi:hypothetical protein